MNDGGEVRLYQTSRASALPGIVACLLQASLYLAAADHARNPTVGSTINATAAYGGIISPDGPIALATGEDIEFSIAPTGSYHILDVEVDGISVGPVSSYTFVNVTNDRTIEAFFHIPWATEVVSYTAGTNAHQYGGDSWLNPACSTGEPSRTTGTFLWDDVTMFNAPYLNDQLVSIGSAGELVISFDHDVRNDPYNPYGIDLLVFGNCMFEDTDFPNGLSGGTFSEPGRISVSQNGITWHDVTVTADNIFPTLGFTDTPHAHGNKSLGRGSNETCFVTPVDPSISYNNKTYAELIDLYNGSGGGSGVDISEAGLDWIRYVKVWQPPNELWSTEVDAFSDIAPSLLRELNVTSERACTPSAGTHTYTSGVPVNCSVTTPSIDIGSGTQIVCTGWAGTSSVPASGTGTSVRFTISAESSIEWKWETRVQLNAYVSEGGSVSISNGWYALGSNATITAVPFAEYDFAGWSGEISGDTNNPSITLTMDRAKTVTALFSPTAAAPTLGEWLASFDLTNETEEVEAGLDRDKDGFDAQAEYLSGTDPNDQDSLLKVIDAWHTNSHYGISWLGGTNGSADPFTVWSRTDLTAGWIPVASNLQKSVTGTNTWSDTNGTANIYLKVTVE